MTTKRSKTCTSAAAAAAVFLILATGASTAKKPEGGGGPTGFTDITLTLRDCVVGVDCPQGLPDRFQSDSRGGYPGVLNEGGLDLDTEPRSGRAGWLDFTECAIGPCDPPWSADYWKEGRLRTDYPYALDGQTGIYEPIDGSSQLDWRDLEVGEVRLVGVQFNFNRNQKGKSPVWIMRLGRTWPTHDYCRQPENTPMRLERLADTQDGKRQWTLDVLDPADGDISCLTERGTPGDLGQYHMRFSAQVVED